MLAEKEIKLAQAAKWFGSGYGYDSYESPEMAVAKARGQKFAMNEYGTWYLIGGRKIADIAQEDIWHHFGFRSLQDYFEYLRQNKNLVNPASWYQAKDAKRKNRVKYNSDGLIRSVGSK